MYNNINHKLNMSVFTKLVTETDGLHFNYFSTLNEQSVQLTVVLLWNGNSYEAHQNWIRDLLIMNTFSVLVKVFGLVEVTKQKRVQGVLGFP